MATNAFGNRRQHKQATADAWHTLACLAISVNGHAHVSSRRAHAPARSPPPTGPGTAASQLRVSTSRISLAAGDLGSTGQPRQLSIHPFLPLHFLLLVKRAPPCPCDSHSVSIPSRPERLQNGRGADPHAQAGRQADGQDRRRSFQIPGRISFPAPAERERERETGPSNSTTGISPSRRPSTCGAGDRRVRALARA